MLNTSLNYRLIARDLATSLARKAAAPDIARETAYYNANIGKVKSVDDLLGDSRLYAYAMKAMGLEEMTYAKAFMRKVVTEGVSSASSFANRLADDRYIAFARAFDFAQGASATGSVKTPAQINGGIDPDPGDVAGTGVVQTPAQLTGILDIAGPIDFSGTNEVSFLLSSKVDAATTKSATIVLNTSTLAGVAGSLGQVTGAEIVKAINDQIEASGDANLKGKVQVGLGLLNNLYFETTAYTNLGSDDAYGGTGLAADAIYALGANRTLTIANVPLSAPGQTAVDLGFGTGLPPDAKARSVTEAYLRQALETDAGAEDTGVRLALYFARIAPTATSGYSILGDNALSQVVKTVLGLPGSAGSEAIARQAAIIEDRIDLADFKDPAKLDRFIQRFTAIWDAQNNTAGDPILALFDGTGGAGIAADLLVNLQQNRSGS